MLIIVILRELNEIKEQFFRELKFFAFYLSKKSRKNSILIADKIQT